jgi:hypothetical protein
MNQATRRRSSGTDVALRQLIMGFQSNQMIYVAAKLEPPTASTKSANGCRLGRRRWRRPRASIA